MRSRIARTRTSLLLVAASSALALLGLAACVGDEPVVTSTPNVDAAPSSTGASDGATSAPPPMTDGGTNSPTDAADAATRFCQSQTAPLGVTDFFCADFDGTDVTEGFTTATVPDGGAVSRITDIFYSDPASITTSGGAFLQWEKSSGQTVAEIDARVRLNVGALGGVAPDSPNFVTLLELATLDTNIRLEYSRGGNPDGTGPYTGYFIDLSSCPSACGHDVKKLSTSPTLNVWTDVRVIWAKTGALKVTYNDVDVLNTTTFGSTSTKATVKLGLVGYGTPPAMGRHAFDNLIVQIRRQ